MIIKTEHGLFALSCHLLELISIHILLKCMMTLIWHLFSRSDCCKQPDRHTCSTLNPINTSNWWLNLSNSQHHNHFWVLIINIKKTDCATLLLMFPHCKLSSFNDHTSAIWSVIYKIPLFSVVFTLIGSFTCAQLAKLIKSPRQLSAELVTDNVQPQI